MFLYIFSASLEKSVNTLVKWETKEIKIFWLKFFVVGFMILFFISWLKEDGKREAMYF